MIDARAEEVARLIATVAAAEIMPRFRRLSEGAIRTKSGPMDLVTDADVAAEHALVAGLGLLFPGVPVIGEEAATNDPSLLDRLGDTDLAFVVDPVDGTANFAAGLPLFGCMASLIRRGEPIAGWIHDPISRDTAITVRGEGAWVEDADGSRRDLRVASAAPFAQMTGALNHRYLPAPLAEQVRNRLGLIGSGWELRCSAHEWRMVASGGMHALMYWRLMPWDHAAGWLLHREAGGYSARFDGGTYDARVRTGGLLAAPDQATWQALSEALLSGG